MKKPKKTGLIIISILVLLVGLIVFFTIRQKKQAIGNDYFPLQFGDSNEYVKALQQWLISEGATLKSGADGIFGDETKAACISVLGTDSVDYKTYNSKIA